MSITNQPQRTSWPTLACMMCGLGTHEVILIHASMSILILRKRNFGIFRKLKFYLTVTLKWANQLIDLRKIVKRFDEIGNYDIPAVISYVLAKTGRSTMSWIGHSMGSGTFFICMSLHPELNSKIDVMIALAPASSLAKSKTSIRFLAPFVNQWLVCYSRKVY